MLWLILLFGVMSLFIWEIMHDCPNESEFEMESDVQMESDDATDVCNYIVCR